MECVILAGGLGTRMRPVTEAIPKALVSVAGRPFVDWQLDWLAASGVTRVVLSIGHRGELLRQHVGGGDRFGLRVDYVDEGSWLRGTGGALRLALDQGELSEAFFVLYGDSYLSVSLPAVWSAFVTGGRPALMTVLRNEARWDASNADFADGRVVLYDKTHAGADRFRFIDYGLLALSQNVVREIPDDRVFDLADLLHRLSVEGRLSGFEVSERFYEVGSPAGLADLEAHLTVSGRRAVFLDRDGVLNRALVRDGRPFPPRRPEDLEILPGAVEACASLQRAGFLLVVVTNQPDVARGSLSVDALSALHEALVTRIPVDAVLWCPHDDADGCSCRKPAPGLLLQAAERFGIDLRHSVMVGDRWRDVEAGQRVGCRTVFVDAGYVERRPEDPDLTVASLAEAVPWILETCGCREETKR